MVATVRSVMRRLSRLSTFDRRRLPPCHRRHAPRRAFSSSSHRVSIVYGSFCQDDSLMDAEHIGEYMQARFDSTEAEFRISNPIEGDRFDFESLADTDYLVVSLKLAAATNPGCLGHMRHAVWGNGDERWRATYMSMPRYVDRLLEECGSERFYARGERGEPHGPTGADGCDVEEWTAGAWEAMLESARAGEAGAPPVSWNALWEHRASGVHHNMTEWGLRDLVRQTRRYALPGGPSSFAVVGSEHGEMMDDAKAEAEEEIRLYREQVLARRKK